MACLLVGCGANSIKNEDFYLYRGDEIVSDEWPQTDMGEVSINYSIFEGEELENCNTSKGIGLGSTLEEVYEAYKDFGDPMIVADNKVIEGLSLEEIYSKYDEYCKEGHLNIIYHLKQSGDQWVKIDYSDQMELAESGQFPLFASLLIVLEDKEVVQVLITISRYTQQQYDLMYG